IKSSEVNKLYIRLPINIKDEVFIKDLHPNIVKVQIPRQKKRWCFAEFRSKEELLEAIEDLKKIKINNKSIHIKRWYKKSNRKDKPKPTPSEGATTESLETLLNQN
ncbi:unnamed protein product, partial [Phyllotreta striolata]